ncbi:MAG: redoxin domain-containing protein [Rubrobacter sp.]|nr:redoxin domain-containing protein [Rubrobacter sp.]
MAHAKAPAVPDVGAEVPDFELPGALGGQLRLALRTVVGPVVVVFLRGPWSEEDVGYFRRLSAKEDELNLAGATLVGIGALEPEEARDFARKTGTRSYVLYDYTRSTVRDWGLLEQDRERGERARPAVFIVGTDGRVAHRWLGERPSPEELLSRVSGMTGLPEEHEQRRAARRPATGGEG